MDEFKKGFLVKESNVIYPLNISEDELQKLSFLNLSTENLNLISSSFPGHEAFDKDVQYFVIFCYSLASFLSLVGNITVIIVLSFGKRTSIRGYLVNLAVADLTMATFCIPFSYTSFMFNYWIFLPEFCSFVMFFQHVSVTSSVYTLVAIGFDRYKALVYPLNERWTKTRAPYVIGAIWGFSLLVSSVQLVVSHSDERHWNGNKYYTCNENWPYTENAIYEKIYTIIVFMVTFGLPILSLGYTYVSIANMMWNYRLPGNAEPNRDQQRLQAKIKVINMMLTVMVCFVLCWFPLHVLQIIVYFAPKLVHCRSKDECFAYYTSFFVCHWIAMSNSFMNPIIYCFMSKNFREDFIHILVKCRQSGLNRRSSELRSRSDVGSSFRSILYITHRTSVQSCTRTCFKSKLSSDKCVKDAVELKLMTNKEVKRRELCEEGQDEIAHYSSSLSYTQSEEEEIRNHHPINSNVLKSCVPNIAEDNMV